MLDKQTWNKYAKAPLEFLQDRLIDVDGTVRKASEVLDPWQIEDFQALAPAMQRVTGRTRKAAISRAYWERGRGHDKTSGIAAVVSYLLAFANRPLRGYCFAADKDQASLLKDAMATLLRLNPSLGKVLEVQKEQVVNIASGHPGKGSTLQIFTSDVGSSYGILPDFIVCDELTHWGGDGSLWHSIISSAAKRKHCLMLIIANAGFCDSWQWNIREAIRNDPNWIFSRLDGPVASWITDDRLEEQRRMLPAIAYERLWLNRWSSSGGDALRPEDIHRAFNPIHRKMLGTEPNYRFVAGVDLGLTRDNSAVVVLAIHQVTGSLRLANAALWRPNQTGNKVQIEEVERAILDFDQQYQLEAVGFDPWQAEHLGQRLEALTEHRRRNQRRFQGAKPWVRMIPPTSSNLREQATLTIETFQDGRFHSYEYEPLRNDLLKLRVEEKSYGIRLVSPRDADGHGDTFSAFTQALLVAHEESTRKRTTAGAIDFGHTNDRFANIVDKIERYANASYDNEYTPTDPRLEYADGFLRALDDEMRRPDWGNWIQD